MHPDLQQLFERQAAWQRARARLSWPEKVRMAELLREAANGLRGQPATAAVQTASANCETRQTREREPDGCGCARESAAD